MVVKLVADFVGVAREDVLVVGFAIDGEVLLPAAAVVADAVMPVVALCLFAPDPAAFFASAAASFELELDPE
jgi:hypothetical protein